MAEQNEIQEAQDQIDAELKERFISRLKEMIVRRDSLKAELDRMQSHIDSLNIETFKKEYLTRGECIDRPVRF